MRASWGDVLGGKVLAGKILAILGTVLLCSAAAWAQQPLVQSKAFAPGQSVRLEVNVGDVHIFPNSDDHQLRLIIRTRHGTSIAEMQSWIRQFDVTGNRAEIHLHMPKTGNRSGTVSLYVPSSTNLSVDLGVGDMTISDVAGDKNLDMNIGDLTIGGLEPSDYGVVHLGTRIGDLNDEAFSVHESGWLGKSEDFVGKGKYRLNAHVGIGDLRLQKSRIRDKNGDGETD
jgi:hypothetical protein